MPRALTPVGHPRGIAGPVNPCLSRVGQFPRTPCARLLFQDHMDGSRQSVPEVSPIEKLHQSEVSGPGALAAGRSCTRAR
eukprot:scaffold2056_cov129-Isochrysis_galbana.AAC.1